MRARKNKRLPHDVIITSSRDFLASWNLKTAGRPSTRKSFVFGGRGRPTVDAVSSPHGKKDSSCGESGRAIFHSAESKRTRVAKYHASVSGPSLTKGYLIGYIPSICDSHERSGSLVSREQFSSRFSCCSSVAVETSATSALTLISDACISLYSHEKVSFTEKNIR